MAKNIFDATLDVNNDIKVNSFDWSHANNLTTQIGRITPVFCELVPPKSSVRINPNFGLQFMPMVFPVQTRMKARMAFFKYPLRALWKDYRDFVGNFKQGLEEPYVSPRSTSDFNKMFKTGGLADYLGIPTTLVGNYGSYQNTTPKWLENTSNTYWYNSKFDGFTADQVMDVIPTMGSNDFLNDGSYIGTSSQTGKWMTFAASLPKFDSIPSLSFRVKLGNTINSAVNLTFDYVVTVWQGSDDPNQVLLPLGISHYSFNSVSGKPYPANFTINVPLNNISGAVDTKPGLVTVTFRLSYSSTFFNPDNLILTPGTPMIPSMVGVSTNSGITDITMETSPYWNGNSDGSNNEIKLSAYAFRAYEGIYNSYFRDDRNNPYYINGEVQYNQWIPTYDGGEDNNLYELHYANWERDFLTTAVQSPQQGNAPLVGITTYTERAQVFDENGSPVVENGSPVIKEISKVAIVDEDGKKYGISWNSDSDGLNGVEYTELDNGTVMRQPRSLIDVATSGISITDLRNVNAYQKFLELNMRKGYSYREIIEGRFDVKVRYSDLLLPEFIGGLSRDVDMNAITQNTDLNAQSGDGSYAGALGSQAGIAGVRGNAGHTIECFCDEESIIMGVLVVTPLPVYTQLLPKHFTYRGLLDHYQPEFNHIGFQPILYKEVCPTQVYNADNSALNDVFGYNRPWYEYVQKYDQAHGLFRTNMSNFLMHRVFNEKPELSKSFLIVDPDDVTDVFSVTETTDKIYGQIWFDCTAKLPISRVAIPRLD